MIMMMPVVVPVDVITVMLAVVFPGIQLLVFLVLLVDLYQVSIHRIQGRLARRAAAGARPAVGG